MQVMSTATTECPRCHLNKPTREFWSEESRRDRCSDCRRQMYVGRIGGLIVGVWFLGGAYFAIAGTMPTSAVWVDFFLGAITALAVSSWWRSFN